MKCCLFIRCSKQWFDQQLKFRTYNATCLYYILYTYNTRWIFLYLLNYKYRHLNTRLTGKPEKSIHLVELSMDDAFIYTFSIILLEWMRLKQLLLKFHWLPSFRYKHDPMRVLRIQIGTMHNSKTFSWEHRKSNHAVRIIIIIIIRMKKVSLQNRYENGILYSCLIIIIRVVLCYIIVVCYILLCSFIFLLLLNVHFFRIFFLQVFTELLKDDISSNGV